MPRKTLQIQVELDVQAVTCPGVWLCPNGKVSLQVYLLDSCIQTTALHPIFPLLYHEKFVFYKTFYTAHSLGDLQRSINKEFLYAELIQWQHCDIGNVLATFQTCLTDVLYPTTYEGAIAGVDVDLLMEPSKIFPGIIAPKIEISSRTTIEEIVCSSNQKRCNSFVVNPKTVTSDSAPIVPKRNQLHQRKVCHSIGYHKSRRCARPKRPNKPPFVFRKADDELLARKPQGLESGSTEKCKCCFRSLSSNTFIDKKADYSLMQSPSDKTYSKLTDEFLKQYPKPVKMKHRNSQRGRHSKRLHRCSCGSGHAQENCPVCSKYRLYFEGSHPCSCESSTRMPVCKQSSIKESYVRKVTTCSPTRERYRQSSRSPVRTLGKEHHYQSAAYKAKPCDCLPPKRIQERAQGNEIACNCSVSSNDDKSSNRRCFCSPRKKPSLAEQIHQRLKQTLDCAPTYPFVDLQLDETSEVGSPYACSCPRLQNCRHGFYKSLGKFYRDLRRC